MRQAVWVTGIQKYGCHFLHDLNHRQSFALLVLIRAAFISASFGMCMGFVTLFILLNCG